jgi:hypothetical protein
MIFVTNAVEAARLDSSGNLLIGQTTNTQNYRLVIKGSAGTADDLAFNSDATRAEIQSFNSKPLALNRQGNNVLICTDAGSVGIGTSSPTAKLHVKDATGTAVTLLNLESGYSNPSGNKSILWTDATNALGRISISYTASTGSTMSFGSLYNGGYQTSDLMVLTNTGNLGLGVTPSAWSAFKAFEIASAGNSVWSAGSNDIRVASNYVYNSGPKYVANGLAAMYEQGAGVHYWYTAPNNTSGANQPISFTQAMTLDASSNLFVGGTTGSSRLNLQTTTSSSADSNYITMYNAGENVGHINWINGNGDLARITGTKLGAGASANDGILTFSTATDTVLAERARITSGGNLLVGVPAAFISADNRVSIEGSRAAEFKSTGGASAITLDVWNNATTGDNIFVSFRTETADTQRGSITYNRGAGQVAYNITSDVRLKDNIANAADSGDKVDAIKVRQFDWKETGNHVDYGFVAQELNEVAPHSVTKPEDDEAMWSVDYSKLVPMLVKEIQSLRQRVAQLEGK